MRKQLLHFLQRRFRDQAVAEDILQNAFLRVLESKNQPRTEDAVVAWFYRILCNFIIDDHRRRSVQTSGMERWVRELETSVAPEPVSHDIACKCIDRALNDISPGYAQLLREVELGEKPLTAFAAAQGIIPRNAPVRAHQARAALRKQLERCCGACATHGCLDCTCRTSIHPSAPVPSA